MFSIFARFLGLLMFFFYCLCSFETLPVECWCCEVRGVEFVFIAHLHEITNHLCLSLFQISDAHWWTWEELISFLSPQEEKWIERSREERGRLLERWRNGSGRQAQSQAPAIGQNLWGWDSVSLPTPAGFGWLRPSLCASVCVCVSVCLCVKMHLAASSAWGCCLCQYVDLGPASDSSY